MYGTGYSGMGSFSGLGGISSYGGGYGSSYGGSYGSSYVTASASAQNKPAVEGDPSSPEQQKKNQQINQRKLFFEEWFKMMGGLKSILEMGFAAIALVNFWTKSIEIYKKMMDSVQGIAKSLIAFIQSKIPTKVLSNLTKPQKRGKAVKSILLYAVRLFAMVLLCVGIKLRQDIIREAKSRKQEMIHQLQKLKQGEMQMRVQDQGDNQLVLESDPVNKEANL